MSDPVQEWSSKWVFVYENAPRLAAASISDSSNSEEDMQNMTHAVKLCERLYHEIERRRWAEAPEGAVK